MTYLSEVLADSPNAVWMLDETAGTNANDSGPNNLDGTYAGTYSHTGTVFGFPAVDVATDGRIDLGDNNLLSPHAGASGLMTIEALINPDGDGCFFGKGGSGGYEYDFHKSGTVVGCSIWDTGGNIVVGPSTNGPELPTNGVDYHVVVTYNRASTTALLYVNGVNVALEPGTGTFTGLTSSNGTAIGTIGRRTDSANFDGRIAGVAIYPTVLSPTRIAAHYTAALAGPVVTPTLDQEGFRWRNDDGSETTATWVMAQDVGASMPLSTNVRLRAVINATGDPAATAYTLYYKKSTDSTWLPVAVGSGGGDPVYVAASSNITSGGAATTAQLSAPPGKTTADFVTGRMWDDENGTDTIDVTVDDYTEVEWCLRAQSPAVNGDIYQFRIYAASTPFDTYTVTPQWTLASPAGPTMYLAPVRSTLTLT